MNSVPEPTRLPKLHLSLRQAPPLVDVRRGEDIPDTFWLQARAEWGSTGKVPARAITLPLEQFLANLAWLGPSCRRFKVEIEWEEGLKRQVMASNAERKTLDEALRSIGRGRPMTFSPDATCRTKLSFTTASCNICAPPGHLPPSSGMPRAWR